MSKKPWTKKPFRPKPAVKAPEPTPAKADPFPNDTPRVSEVPPPMPPLSDAPPAGEAPRPNHSHGKLDAEKIKAGLGQAFCSLVKGSGKAINLTLQNSPYRVEIQDVTPEEGELWATFAMPVLETYLPNLEQRPLTVLAVVTGAILSGKIEVKKKEPIHDTNTSEN